MPISRLFNAAEDAAAAVEDLKRAGFGGVPIHVVGGTADAKEIEGLGIAAPVAEGYAGRIRGGATLLAVQPPFGGAERITEIMRRARPGDSGAPDPIEAGGSPAPAVGGAGLTGATPLSAALQMPVLSSDPAPLSSWLGFRTLTRSQAPAARGGAPLLSRKAAPLSSAAHVRTLWGSAAPLSSRLGVKTLWQSAAPLSSRLGWKTLLQSPALLSAKIGGKTLLNNPAPLSSLLGAPVLIKKGG